MNKEQKAALLKEARMQMQAIRTLEKYNMAALAAAGLGAALFYFSFRAQERNLVYIICSLLLAVLGGLCSTILTIGIRNGKQNVEKILGAAEGKDFRPAPPKPPSEESK